MFHLRREGEGGRGRTPLAEGSLRLVEPSHDIPEWMVFVRGRSPLVPDFLRETADLCEQIAATYGGEYEGWAGLLTKEETAE